MEFADEILELTEGYGVDVILNSLAGEAIQRGVHMLAPRRPVHRNREKRRLRRCQPGLGGAGEKRVPLAVVDLDLNLKLQPARYRQLLQHILEHVAAGNPRRCPSPNSACTMRPTHFALMASGKHTGKIVISIPGPESAQGGIEAIAAPPPQPLVSHDGGYLIVAEWAVSVSSSPGGSKARRGIDCAERAFGSRAVTLQPPSRTSSAAGHRIEVVTGDIAEPGTAERLVHAVENAGFRLAGVLHSAMVLADEIVLNMTDSAARRVFAPKVIGSWWLHQATATRDVDWWLTFSSASALLGTPGQGAYAAANSWVDGLVAHRRSVLGLPAVGINWGPWAEVGRAQFFADLGVSLITVEQGLAAMQAVLAADRAAHGCA